MADATIKIACEPTINEPGGGTLGANCPSRLLEITPSPYTQGQEIQITAWGSDIRSLRLYVGSESLGTGDVVSLSDTEQKITETVEFNGSTTQSLDNVIDHITKVTAQTEITAKKTSGTTYTYKSSGSVVPFKKIGGSCVGVDTDKEVYYGTVLVAYDRSDNGKRWKYILPNKSGTLYFFVKDGNDVVSTFTVLIGGTSGVAYRDVTLVYTDIVTEIAVADATVIIDEDLETEQTGTTDILGKVTFLTVKTGTHYIKSTKLGYLDTDADDLDNNSILVT